MQPPLFQSKKKQRKGQASGAGEASSSVMGSGRKLVYLKDRDGRWG